MLFLIEYNRKIGQIVTFKTFDGSERRKAEDSRLQMELELNRLAVEHEVVLLEAATEEALRRTHQRYFENLSELVKLPV
ncbi:MAG: hypothetical protein ABR577_07630 [Pyrinomonadaceae bacterium]